MSDDELAVYTAGLLMSPQRNGLSDRERITSIYTNIGEALKYLVSMHIMTNLLTLKLKKNIFDDNLNLNITRHYTTLKI